MRIMPNFFLIRIDKEKQKEYKYRASGSSLIYQPQTAIFHSKNMEHGEIVQIGDRILANPEFYGAFDNCKIGDTLITHWSVETTPPIDEDEKYYYYVVQESNVRGYFDGETITPHPRYVFLKNEDAIDWVGEYDGFFNEKIKKTESGLILIADWKDSELGITHKKEFIRAKIMELSRSRRTPDVQAEIERLGAEEIALNKDTKKSIWLPYKVAFSSKTLNRDCGTEVKEDDILFCLNKAAQYICNFQNKPYKYIICPTDYVAFLDKRKKATA